LGNVLGLNLFYFNMPKAPPTYFNHGVLVAFRIQAVKCYPGGHTATAAKNVSSTQEVNSVPFLSFEPLPAKISHACAYNPNQNLAGGGAVLSGWLITPSGPKLAQLQCT